MVEVIKTAAFNKWLRGLKDREAKARISYRLIKCENGYLGDYKSLGADLFEMRLSYGPGYRLYFTQRGAALILLLIGGDKSTQSRDIRKARDLLKDIE